MVVRSLVAVVAPSMSFRGTRLPMKLFLPRPLPIRCQFLVTLWELVSLFPCPPPTRAEVNPFKVSNPHNSSMYVPGLITSLSLRQAPARAIYLSNRWHVYPVHLMRLGHTPVGRLSPGRLITTVWQCRKCRLIGPSNSMRLL